MSAPDTAAPADFGVEARIRALEGRWSFSQPWPGRRALRADLGLLADLEARYQPVVYRGSCRCHAHPGGVVLHDGNCVLFWLDPS